MPFGARIQYLIYVNRPQREVVGCLQFSSPAWRMRARDEWIGWTEERRKTALQQVVNNSRFLVETLVDRQRFHGGWYRASNWIELGKTVGRGRMDRAHKPNEAQVKTIWVYPLVKNTVHQLKKGSS